MQTASILLSLSGERDNQIPKYNVTPAEAMLLRALHGDEAVTEIDIVGANETTSRAERGRLFAFYSRPNPRGGRMCPELDALFPGSAARLPDTFDEIELDESFFKDGGPAKAADPLDHDEDGKKGGSKPKAARKPRKAKAEDEAETDDKSGDETEGEAADGENLFN